MKHVLVIEDDIFAQEIAKMVFTDKNIACQVVGDLMLAGVMLASEHDQISCIVLDGNVPDTHGASTVSTVNFLLSVRASYPHIPIIAYSGDETRLREMKTAGAVRTFLKPNMKVYEEVEKIHLS